MIDQNTFREFISLVVQDYEVMNKKELFTVSIPGDVLWAEYLKAFPPGTNEIYRVRPYHDCSADRNFIKNLGPVVTITNGVVQTVWHKAAQEAPEPYRTVASRLESLVSEASISNIFRSKENQYGVEVARELLENGKVHLWYNLVGQVRGAHKSASPAAERGRAETTQSVFRRGLETLTVEAFEQVFELLREKNLYRGEEYRKGLVEFYNFKKDFLKLNSDRARELFAWEHWKAPCTKLRNTAIGTLLIDLSEGRDLEEAVRAYESVVAPANYKRPKSLITKAMVEKAEKTLVELGLESAISRTFATPGQVEVNSVLFTDPGFRPNLKGGLLDLLAKDVKEKEVSFKEATPIGIEEFESSVVPKAVAMNVVLSNDNLNNLVSITAPQNPEDSRLLAWDNDFAWSYVDGAADSIKARVKKAGGRVEGAKLRVSLSWYNYDDLDLYCKPPRENIIYFGNKAGVLDVDMNAGGRRDSRTPVENLSWMKVPRDGEYEIWVKNYAQKESIDGGFVLEVEDSSGAIKTFTHKAHLGTGATSSRVSLEVQKGVVTRVHHDKAFLSEAAQVTKWGVTTQTLTKVSSVCLSPNHWGPNKVGAKHWFFILDSCQNPEPVRGFYPEFLRKELYEHRKVFEILGARTLAQPKVPQLSGVGFTKGRGDSVGVQVQLENGAKKNYKVNF